MGEIWYNYTSSNQINSRGAASNSPRPDIKKGEFLMHPHITLPAPSSKTCPRCHQSKPATTDFWTRNKSRRDGLADWCKSCCAEHRLITKESQAERNRKYYAKNKAREAERSHQYHLANKERLSARARARFAKSEKKSRADYRAKNREAFNAYQRLRAERQRNAPGSHTDEDVTRQYHVQKGKCYWCSCDLKDKYQTDHVIPLSRGGSDGMENIVVACSHCNQSKKNKLPSEWHGAIGTP